MYLSGKAGGTGDGCAVANKTERDTLLALLNRPVPQPTFADLIALQQQQRQPQYPPFGPMPPPFYPFPNMGGGMFGGGGPRW